MAFRIVTDELERCRAFCNEQGLHADALDIFIGCEKDGELVACAGYDRYHGTSIEQHIYVAHGVTIPRSFWWFIAYYPFIQLGVDMMIGITPSTNKKALRLAKKYGYIEKYRIEGAVNGGDLVVQTLNKNDCKWLGIKL